MARMMLLLAFCVLPALVSAIRPAANPFIVQGRVYCDTCRAGYETSATTSISAQGSTVSYGPRPPPQQQQTSGSQGPWGTRGGYAGHSQNRNVQAGPSQGRAFMINGGDAQTDTRVVRGARVKVECKDRETQKLVYSIDATTDSTGTYKIMVNEDHEDQLCDCMLISSPLSDCASADPGRDRARVILTRNNGIASDNRFVNAMGFLRYQPMSGCKQLLEQYEMESEF